MTPLQKLQKARAALIGSQPFFASLALRLVMEESRALKTMGTDGVRLVYNPDFVESLTLPELTGVWAHEAMHCALDHTGRLGNRDRKRFNIAADHAINPLLIDAGLTLPKSALIDPRYRNKSAEEIYALLPVEQPDNAQGGQGRGQGAPGGPSQPGQGQDDASGAQGAADDDPGGCGGVLPAPEGQTADEAAQLEQDWKVATIQAANVARAAGKLPGGVDRIVTEVKKPQIDWKEVLRRFISSAAPSDYSWTPPNRRHIASGLYLPALKPDSLGKLGVFIDTSGSIGAATLAMFSAELNAILEDARPEAVHLIYCDAAINSAEEISADDYPVKLKAKGGGGTDFRPPFAHIEREGIDIVAAIYLTDLEGPFPQEPEFPTLWACTTAQVAPWGETIRLPAAA